jgi:predicted alpha/beta hydrolase family esterase
VTVPPAAKLPDKAAVSNTEPPAVIFVADSVVVIVGLVLLTVKSSHGLKAALLLASPEYTASKLYEPACVRVTEAEFSTTPLATVTVETTVAVPVQVDPLNS